MKKPGVTRREVVIGGTAALAACGRTAPYDLAASGSGEDMKLAPQLPERAAFVPSAKFPLHLTASTTLASNSSGGVNAISLQNPLGTPMEILEIKWQLRCTNLVLTGGAVSCKLDLGKIPITNGFVPVWGFGRALNVDLGEYPRDSLLMGGPAERFNEYSWKLPHPLYIPAGAVLTPTLRHNGYIQENIEARISYSARSLPANHKPKKIALPWVSSYTSKVFDKMGALDTDASRETDVVNPHAEPIRVQHVIGRIATFDRAEPTVVIIDDADMGGALLRVRAVDSRGDPIIPRLALFHSVFSLTTRAWDSSFTMDPKAFYLFVLQKTAPATQSADAFSSQAMISVVGWRELGGAS